MLCRMCCSINQLKNQKIMQKKFFSLLLATALVSSTFMACNDEKKADETKMEDTSMDKMDKMEPMKEDGVMVGGAMMVPSKDIVDNAAGSADHTTLVAAVKAAELVETLKSAGPFTVFAPTNEAFGVPGALKSTDLKDGQKLKTVQGEELMIGYKDGKWTVTDAKGGVANITIADVISSNGVTYVIDAVLMPKK